MGSVARIYLGGCKHVNGTEGTGQSSSSGTITAPLGVADAVGGCGFLDLQHFCCLWIIDGSGSSIPSLSYSFHALCRGGKRWWRLSLILLFNVMFPVK